jgi:hypothetical protein
MPRYELYLSIGGLEGAPLTIDRDHPISAGETIHELGYDWLVDSVGPGHNDVDGVIFATRIEAETSRLDYVHVTTLRGPRSISWASRDELLRQMRPLETMAGLVQAFEAVGASRLVVLDTPQDVNLLIEAIEVWARDVGGLDKLPDDVFELRDHLYAELEDRGVHG